MAHILHCDIADMMLFDRKHYYYPDLPKGYQITQCTRPVGINGYIEYVVSICNKEVNIYLYSI